MIVSASYLVIIFIALGVLIIFHLHLSKKKRPSQYENDVFSRGFSVDLTAE